MSLSGHINISLLIPNVYEQIIKYYHISQVAISDNIYVFKLICTFSSYWNITQVIRYSSPSSHEEEKKKTTVCTNSNIFNSLQYNIYKWMYLRDSTAR